jgi:replicative DNA helicase
MDDALAGELAKKEAATNRLLAVARAQNAAIKNNETAAIISLDAEKNALMEAMSEIDNSIKPFILRNKRYPASVQDTVKKINICLNNLIVIEKENEKLLTSMELSASGRHVDAYKRSIK